MSKRPLVHSSGGIELARKFAERGERFFTSAQARVLGPKVGLSARYTPQALHHLQKSGWVIRLRPGLYALSPEVFRGAPLHEFEIAMVVVQPAAISHWSALNFHGMTEQTPRTVFVLTTTEKAVPRSAARPAAPRHPGVRIQGVEYRFIRVPQEQFFGTQKVWVGESQVSITDPERTLLDGLARPQYYGGFTEVLHAFERRGAQLDVERIVRYALRLQEPTIAKRLGWVIEYRGVSHAAVERLRRVRIQGFRPLDAKAPRQGPCNTRWMIQENLPGNAYASALQ